MHIFGPRILMNADDGDKNKGGGTGAPDLTELQKKLDDQAKVIQRLNSQLGRNKGSNKEKNQRGGDDLINKLDRQKTIDNQKGQDTRAMEESISFNMGVNSFLEENKHILSDDFKGIVELANKETYDSAADKTNAIRANFIQAFFNTQENVDLLTKTQKSSLENFLKLTKNGREAKAGEVYSNVFEPTFEMLKKLKKAEELEKSRKGYSSSTEGDAYKDKLIDIGKKRFKLKEQ